jgi:spore coat polysaccharide biosynthesis predicted glycosyltransferase SpsG
MTVAFRVAAGPRLGFGHLVRCRSLARALGVELRASVRGSAQTRRAAEAMGWTLLSDAALAGPWNVSLVVVDDPSAREAARWVARARRRGVPVATIHDAGLAHVDSDLAIDGGAVPVRGRRPAGLCGPAFAMLDPSVRVARNSRQVPAPNRVLVALGGGAHVLGLAARLAAELAGRAPDAEIRVARGFAHAARLPPLPRGEWVAAPDGLARELSEAAVAIVAGGVTLFEACAVGAPVVAVAVNDAQHGAVCAMARVGAALDAGRPPVSARTLAGVARRTARLLADPAARRRMSSAGRRIVDGRGVWRAADALRALAQKGVAHAA